MAKEKITKRTETEIKEFIEMVRSGKTPKEVFYKDLEISKFEGRWLIDIKPLIPSYFNGRLHTNIKNKKDSIEGLEFFLSCMEVDE